MLIQPAQSSLHPKRVALRCRGHSYKAVGYCYRIAPTVAALAEDIAAFLTDYKSVQIAVEVGYKLVIAALPARGYIAELDRSSAVVPV